MLLKILNARWVTSFQQKCNSVTRVCMGSHYFRSYHSRFTNRLRTVRWVPER